MSIRKVIKESFTDKPIAWMLKYTGELIPVASERGYHVYGANVEAVGDEILEENVAAASFLVKYDHSEIAVKTIQVWLARVIYESGVNIPVNEQDFFNEIEEAIVNWSTVEYEKGSVDPFEIWESTGIETTDQLVKFYEDTKDFTGEEASKQLNQHFTRVRYGVSTGDFLNSSPYSKDLMFRVSSVGIKWLDVIYKAISQIQKEYNIDTISVVRDEGSTGSESPYKTSTGDDILFMPLEEYLSEERGKPVIESYDLKSNNHSQTYWSKLLNDSSYVSWYGPRTALENALKEGYVLHNVPEVFTSLVEFITSRENKRPYLK